MPSLSVFSTQTSSGLYQLSLNQLLTDAAILSNRTEVLEVLSDLNRLATFLNASDKDELPFEAAYPDHLYIVENKVLCLLSEEEQKVINNAYHHRQKDIIELLLQVSLLYIYTNLRQTPMGGKLRRNLVWRMKDFLNDCSNLPLLMAAFPAEMLWTLSISAFAATGTDYQCYFNERIRILCYENGLLRTDQIVQFLTSLPALENSCLKACENIWMENIGCP